MTIQRKSFITPEAVSQATAKKILSFLNTARTAEEIADAIEIKGERDVGIRVAQNIIDKRAQLGGFKDLKQVTAVSQVGPQRFTDLVNTLKARKGLGTTYIVEGEVKSTGRINFTKEKLAVHAFIGGVEVASTNVDAKGKYRLTFDYYGEPSATELRVIPAKLSFRATTTMALSKTISPARYVMKEQSAMAYVATYDLLIPGNLLLLWQKVTKTYHMYGSVWATVFSGGFPISIDPLPAARIEFYEVDVPIIWLIGTTPEMTEAYLGCAYTAPDGSYDFEFDFSYKTSPWIWSSLFTDKVPDIRARISQFMDGLWKQVYEGPVDWDIAEDFHRDYFIPTEDVFPVPSSPSKPLTGLRFISVGLLPIDTTRIQLGYATADPLDPARISTIAHQPFCGTLRIFGLFAETPAAASYKVQIAEATESSVVGSWTDLTDPLYNRKWNDTLKAWEPMNLGPDPTTGHYQNIDTQPEADWHEHALKVTWNTVNYPNGYFALRIIGYDAASTQIGTYEMPIMRIDNSVPETKLEVVGTTVGGVTDCGALHLGLDRTIEFKVTARDPEGHVLKYWLSGTRGKGATSAGSTVEETRPDPPDVWVGVNNKPVNFAVSALPAALSACGVLAYNFELHVWGLATDCYNVTPGAQRARSQTNLVVSEP